MVLGFMTKFPWGEPTNFREKIIHPFADFHQANYSIDILGVKNPKIHTIREGQRWKEGQIVHMATGVRTKHYNQFNKDIPELEKIKGKQRIDISLRNQFCVAIYIDLELKFIRSQSSYRPGWTKTNFNEDGDGFYKMGEEWFQKFLQNDGITEEQFFRFFKKSLRNGQLLHFTDLKY